MDPLDVAEEVRINAEPSVVVHLSVKLVIALSLLVFLGVGVLTINVYLIKQQVDHLTGDLTILSQIVDRNSDRLTVIEVGTCKDLEKRVERLEKTSERK